MPDKNLSKEKVNLITSGSASSPHPNSKHLAYVTQQAIAGDKVVKLYGRVWGSLEPRNLQLFWSEGDRPERFWDTVIN